jgi:hypothetical protein
MKPTETTTSNRAECIPAIFGMAAGLGICAAVFSRPLGLGFGVVIFAVIWRLTP